MIQLLISDSIAEQLSELMDSAGLDSLEATVQWLVDLNDKVYEQVGPAPTSNIDDLVSSITNYNASREVILSESPNPELFKAHPPKFEWYSTNYPNDRLVKKAVTQEEKDAIVSLYRAIPSDIWGTQQAEQLWQRQIKFMSDRP